MFCDIGKKGSENLKLALIFPSNMLHAPYVNYYTKILDENSIKYDIINWNKLDVKEEQLDGYTFNLKCELNSNILKKTMGYYRFSKFVKKILRKEKYDKLIVFIPQFAVFLNDILKKEYKNKYILDIRDYGKANMYAKKLNVTIGNSNFTSISSEGYKKWLTSKYNYVISHNISFENNTILNNNEVFDLKDKKEIIISNIGVIRDYNENCKVIDCFSKTSEFKLKYIGKGICEENLKKYCKTNNISNVFFYGKYEKKQELEFYLISHIINLITPKKNLGNNTAIANRIYNSCISRRPVIVSKGSYMGQIVEKYNLGIVIDLDNDNLLQEVKKYINDFDYSKFIKGCKTFLDKVENEQKLFENKVINFLYE